jgi:hypothetical protein
MPGAPSMTRTCDLQVRNQLKEGDLAPETDPDDVQSLTEPD